mmetsp:Transcript_22038/g.66113  ORF Transcript_22038/g.66113 Transcript_22038/m.66113 type:complete len:104 (-) Transcript_22038:586-897(-)
MTVHMVESAYESAESSLPVSGTLLPPTGLARGLQYMYSTSGSPLVLNRSTEPPFGGDALAVLSQTNLGTHCVRSVEETARVVYDLVAKAAQCIVAIELLVLNI